MKRVLAACFAGAVWSTAAFAQLPLPLDVQHIANTILDGDQDEVTVAYDGHGNFVVVWSDSLIDGNLSGILARRFDGRTGQPLTDPKLINVATLGNQRNASVATASDGRFVVIWEGPDTLIPGTTGIFGRLLDANGNDIATEFPVNTTTAGTQRNPVVAMQGDGNFLVVWQSDQPLGLAEGTSGKNIFGRLFGPNGAPQSGEIVLNIGTQSGDQEDPAVAAYGAGGAWLTAWRGPLGPSLSIPSILVRPLAANGTGAAELPANSSATSVPRGHPSVAANGTSAVVVWEAPDSALRGIYARRLQSGAIVGVEEPVNLNGNLDEREPAVTLNADGDFVTVWVRASPVLADLPDGVPWAPEGSPIVIQGRKKTSGGGFEALEQPDGAPPSDGEFQVNSSGGSFRDPWITSDARGNFVVAWEGTGVDDPFGTAAFYRRFAVAIFADGFETQGTSRWSSHLP